MRTKRILVVVLFLATTLLAESTVSDGHDRYPLDITQEGEVVYLPSGTLANYLIVVENGGDLNLKLDVQDLFPPDAKLINVSVSPTEIGRNHVNWTSNVESGNEFVASLWLDVTECQGDRLMNRVVVASSEGIGGENVSSIEMARAEPASAATSTATTTATTTFSESAEEFFALPTFPEVQDKSAWLDVRFRSVKGKGPYGRLIVGGRPVTAPSFNDLLEEFGYSGTRDLMEGKFADQDVPDMLKNETGSITGSPPETSLVKRFYVGSVNSNKYHYPDCKWARNIPIADMIWFFCPEEARAQGYVPCGTCTPA